MLIHPKFISVSAIFIPFFILSVVLLSFLPDVMMCWYPLCVLSFDNVMMILGLAIVQEPAIQCWFWKLRVFWVSYHRLDFLVSVFKPLVLVPVDGSRYVRCIGIFSAYR